MDAQTLLAEYAGGARSFAGANLAEAKLGANLRNVNLSGADLRRAYLSGADLSEGDLQGANLEHANLVGASLHRTNLGTARLAFASLMEAKLDLAVLNGADLTRACANNADLSHARLAGAIFLKAALIRATLIGADLTEADLRGANLNVAHLVGANLTRANLRNATLDGATLHAAHLGGADLSGASLGYVNLAGADLSGITVDRVVLNETLIVDVDAGAFCTAPNVDHAGPSILDARTVARSYRHPGFKQFMTDCGVPPVLAEYMIDCARSIGEGNLRAMLQSTFISYGGPDDAFARRLHEALRAAQVVTFFFPETAKVGERIHREVYRGINDYDRVLLVCSRSSLSRPGVLNEIEETLAREARLGRATLLLPIRLDDYVISGWKDAHPELAERVGQRVIADFTGTESDPAKFQSALARVIDALKVKPVPASTP